MTERTLKEFLENESLFEKINQLESFPFLVNNVSIMDLILITNYGSKKVFSAFEGNSIQTIAEMLVLNFQNSWENYVKIELLTDNPNNRREVTETTNQTETRLNSKTDVNKISAYNSEDLINDGGMNTDGTDDLDGETVRTLVDEQINQKNAYELLSANGKNSIIKSVMNDISGYLTLDIY